MRKIVDFFKKRWVISLIGLIALSILIWFVGPLVAIAGKVPLADAVVRLVVILIVVLIWGLNNLRVQMQANRANDQIAEGMAQSTQSATKNKGQSDQDVAQLKERFDEAMSVLKKSSRKGGSVNLYELPWYIIIGPPGSGKTTALTHSGLEFPLAERFGKQALRGVGGTRNCDWWFTNDAVILDTAGRYVTQDSHGEADSAEWEGFLNLLKKYRKRRPINGVLISMSLPDLMLFNEHEQDYHIRAIKQRIQELDQQLGIRFPIYVLFTKCDLVAGFMEFFDDLGREERAQVWGMTFPSNEQNVVQRFGVEFDGLLQRLNERLLARLNQERDIRRRSLIYGFPQQMASIKSVAERFLHEIFRPSRYDQEPLLRGVYLTSGTQEGTPIDRLLGALARNFGLDQRALPSYGGHGRSYFITNLLNKVVFQERDVAGANRKFETQRRWLQRGAYAGAIGATIAAALAWSTSFTRNQVYIGRMQERVNDYQAVAEQPLMSNQIDEVLPRLEKLQGINKVYAPFKEDVPLLMGMGLYKGDTLGEAAQAAYHRDLNKIFLPRLAARLEQQLARGVGSPDFRYEALKIYLMLGQPTRLDPALVQSWMSIDWAVSYAQAPEVQGDLQKHLTNLLDAGIEPMALDERLVQDVRNELNQVPFAQLIYGRFKRDELSNDANPFRLTNAIGRQGESVFKRVSGESLDTGIPGLFTKHGFFKIYQVKSGELVNKMRDERWVLDSGRDEISQVELDKLDKDVATLYISDYIAHWDALLNDIAIVEFRDASHAAQVMDVLSAPSSPLRGLLQAVANNTALIKLPGSAGKLAEMAGQAAQEKSRLARIFSSATEGEKINTGIELPGKPIDEHFSRLNELILVESGATPPLDRLINLLSELYGHLQSIQDDAGDSSNILRKLQVEAARQPEPVKGLMQQIVSESKSVKISDLREKINAKWKNNVYPLCKAAIVDRYPVYKNATRESSLRDFGRFFGPGGVLDDFFNNNLQPYVDTAHTPWRWKGKEGAALRMPSSVLLQFQRAALIRDTFFQDGGVKPAISFGLKPKYLSARALRFTLDIDGQKFTYRHGPTQLRNAVWPGPDQRDSARVIFEDPSGAAPTLSNEGPWAWFRLLDQAAMNQLSVDRMEVTFEVGGLKATYEIRANSVVNPFAMSELQQFRCPGRL